jgi:hypothetical protein
LAFLEYDISKCWYRLKTPFPPDSFLISKAIL